MKQTLRAAGTMLVLLGCAFTVTAQTTDSLTITLKVPGIKIDHVVETPYGDRSVSGITDGSLSKPFNKGLITSPEQLLTGQYSGLQILNASGKPGAGHPMISRNGTSIYGSNAPLIVIDGVPMLEFTASDHAGFLSFINPADVASVVLLKDAAMNAVFGAAAANGVLYITTKRGNQQTRPSVSYITTAAVSVLPKKMDVLSADEFRETVKNTYPDKAHLLGTHNTDWQDEIYQNAFSHDHTLQVSGNAAGYVPYHISAGHLNQNGILKTSRNKRSSLALALNPTFFDDHLRLDLTMRKVDQNLRVADEFAIKQAWSFDPTKPVREKNQYGDYYIHLPPPGSAPHSDSFNPLGMLEQRHDIDETSTLNGQAHVQYKLHFMPQLGINLRYALHNQDNYFSTYQPKEMASAAYWGGIKQKTDGKFERRFKEAFLTYDQEISSLQSNIWLVAGANWQTLLRKKNIHETYSADGSQQFSGYSFTTSETEDHTLYGQAGVTVANKYNFNAGISQVQFTGYGRQEKKLNSIGAGISWDIARESFLANNPVISGLNLYSNYSKFSDPESSSFNYMILFPTDIKYEQVSKWNTGVRFALFSDRLTGNVNYYQSTTSDMYLILQFAPGTGYGSRFTNTGSFTANGFEADLAYNSKAAEGFRWSIGANLTYATTKVNELDENMQIYVHKNSGSGRLALTPGSPINSFLLQEQLYDAQGKPIEGEYVTDNSGNRKPFITGQKDPKVRIGLYTDMAYKKWNASFMLRGATGNSVYNLADATTGASEMMWGYDYLNNISGSYYETGFVKRQTNSSYYLQDASYIKLEYLQLGYQVGKVWKGRANLSVTSTLQNLLLTTKYKGQNPEVAGGVEFNQYPYPTTVSLGLKVEL